MGSTPPPPQRILAQETTTGDQTSSSPHHQVTENTGLEEHVNITMQMQPNPKCGKFQRTLDPVSSTSKQQEKKKQKLGGVSP